MNVFYTALILKIVQPSSNNFGNSPESNLTNEDHKLLLQYKDLIREQDQELKLLRNNLATLQNENDTLKYQLQEQQLIVQQLKDQNFLLKTQKSAYDTPYAYSSENAMYTNTYTSSSCENQHSSVTNAFSSDPYVVSEQVPVSESHEVPANTSYGLQTNSYENSVPNKSSESQVYDNSNVNQMVFILNYWSI